MRAGLGFFGQGAHGIDGALAAASSKHDFGHHHGDPHQGHKEEVHQYKRTPAVLAREIGKLPDVSESNGRPSCRKDIGPPRRPLAVHGLSFRDHRDSSLRCVCNKAAALRHRVSRDSRSFWSGRSIEVPHDLRS